MSPGPTDSGKPYDPFSVSAQFIEPVDIPQPQPQRRTGLWIGIVALVLVVLVGGGGVLALVGGGGKRQGSPPPYTLEERARAIASPSLVFVEEIITGYLRDSKTRAALHPKPITFHRRCSGFLVTSDGHALTNAHCVSPDDATRRWAALGVYGRMLVRQKTIDAAQLDEFVKSKIKSTLFTGKDPLSEPESQLHGQLNLATGNVTGEPAIPAQIVKSFAVDAGNVAVIKFAQQNLPVAELNTSATFEVGTPLLTVGYHTSDADFSRATYTHKSKTVTITGVGPQESVRTYQVNDDTGSNSQGGIAIDSTGRVVGMVDSDPSRSDKSNRLVVPISELTKALTDAGVTNSLGEFDKSYRSGLDAYFAGRYSTAAAQLESVVNGSPANATAQAYRQQAVDRQKIEGARSSGIPIWVGALLAGIGGALAVGLTVLLVMVRRRTRGQEPVTPPVS